MLCIGVRLDQYPSSEILVVQAGIHDSLIVAVRILGEAVIPSA